MDRITESFLNDFLKEQELNSEGRANDFEKFANYCVISNEYSEIFEIQDICVGQGGDCGIDGIGILANGRLVESKEVIDDLIEINGYLEVSFIFIQAKSSSSFKMADIGSFGFGVKDFFAVEPKLDRNEFIKQKADIADYIISKSPNMKERPKCKMYYVTTGKWCDDRNLVGQIENIRAEINYLDIFNEIDFHPIGAIEVQDLYRNTKEEVSVTIEFNERVLLPEINGVSEAYLGILPIEEFMKLIIDESSNIRRSIFYDNVRDFQGYNDVNEDIKTTIKSDNPENFVVLNNGISIVAKDIKTMRNKFTLIDYQIVNGCQTSHVIYNSREEINGNVSLPVKLVASDQRDVVNNIIKANNHQTEVKEEELIALSEYQKRLEQFYETFEEDKKLYYERRSKQYNTIPGVEKVRTINISTQIRTFASMFLDQPHKASRFYGTLVKEIGNKIFKNDHQLISYYTSSYAYYKLEYFFRNRMIDSDYRKLKYHMLMMLKYIINDEERPPRFNSHAIKNYCNKITSLLYDQDKAYNYFLYTKEAIDNVVDDLSDTEMTKRKSLTEELIDASKKLEI
jgi:hypothetical protein